MKGNLLDRKCNTKRQSFVQGVQKFSIPKIKVAKLYFLGSSSEKFSASNDQFGKFTTTFRLTFFFAKNLLKLKIRNKVFFSTKINTRKKNLISEFFRARYFNGK